VQKIASFACFFQFNWTFCIWLLGEFASSMLVINALQRQTDARKSANDAKTLEEI